MSVARESRLVVGAAVVETRDWEVLQDYADSLVPAACYCSDDSGV